jgi:hypothetical protein
MVKESAQVGVRQRRNTPQELVGCAQEVAGPWRRCWGRMLVCCGSVVARSKERRSEGTVNRYGGMKPSVRLRWNNSANMNLMEQTSNLLHTRTKTAGWRWYKSICRVRGGT